MPILPNQASQPGAGKLAIIIKSEPIIINGMANVIPSLMAIRNLLLPNFPAIGISLFSNSSFTLLTFFPPLTLIISYL